MTDSHIGVANKPPAAKVCSALWSIGTFAVERKHGRVCAGGRLQVGMWAVMVPAVVVDPYYLLRILFGEHGLSLRTAISRDFDKATWTGIYITLHGGTQWTPRSQTSIHVQTQKRGGLKQRQRNREKQDLILFMGDLFFLVGQTGSEITKFTPLKTNMSQKTGLF